MNSIAGYRTNFLDFLNEKTEIGEPKNLYEPIHYIMNLGGKRLRPILVLVTADIFGKNAQEALNAALAIEMFHNFSLVHDDIMDRASLRRGQPSVHHKWDVNTGILSGDAMLINAYQLFEQYKGETFRELAQLFSRTAIQVCEGQQYDVEYGNQEKIKVEQYLTMIDNKTAALVGAAMEMGAIVGGASSQAKKNIFDFGCLIGKAFQLKDDYLDVFGNKESFGKQIGGDIVENKKTYLYLRAMENSPSKRAEELKHLYTLQPSKPEQKIKAVRQIFKESGAAEETLKVIENYTQDAFAVLDKIDLSDQERTFLKEIGNSLMERDV